MPVDLVDYTVRLLPGLALITTCYLLIRRWHDPLLRIVLLILGFVLIRDAMTPVGLWQIGSTGGVPWLRFVDVPVVLVLFGATTLAGTALLLRADRPLLALVRWGRPDVATLGLGVGGGLLVAAPVLALSWPHALAERGGEVAASLLPALLFFALAGNLAEEVLFRGTLQGRLEQDMSAFRAAVFSGVLFAACHAFLASTVTGVGWPLLAFTLYEGLVCAFLRKAKGVWAAALAHGIAIFLLSAGLV